MILRLALLLALVSGPFAIAGPAEPAPAQWNGYAKVDFIVDGKKSYLIVPKEPAAGNPWIWRTEFFGHEPQGDIALLAKGFHVAYTDMTNQYGAPVAIAHMAAFHDHVVKDYHLANKVVLEGFSRGSLFAFNFAATHPDQVACLYVDAPVCDFKSWPAGFGKGKGSTGDWTRCKDIYGFKSDDEARAYKLNPIDNLAPLAEHKIAILSICGDADQVVPLPENSGLVKERYEKLGGTIQLITKPGGDHHPHSLKDPQPIVDFVLKHGLGEG